jgi:hypothetical protein
LGKTFYVKQRRQNNGSDKDIPIHCCNSRSDSHG